MTEKPLDSAASGASLGSARGWLDEISCALKREKDFRSEGTRVVSIYEGEKEKETPFNILFSNTETLSPALYNSTPRPLVRRRFKDRDPLATTAAKVTQGVLEYYLDDGLSEYASYDDLLKSAVLEGLVPGRGVTRFRYEAKFSEQGSVASECVHGEEVPWDRFCHGFAKKWVDVPWVAFLHFLDKQELRQHFGEVGGLVEVAENRQTISPEGDGEDRKSRTESSNISTAPVWEIWDKQTRKVFFVSPNLPDRILKEDEDPLKLSGFFPCPKPLAFLQKISGLVPTPLYKLYEEQAKELNRVTLRINALIKMLKVRGMYDAVVAGIDKVLESDDGTLVAATNVAALINNGSLEKAIWLFPIEKIYPVLQQLYVQREQVKAVIFEITGIADIMRGTTQASETLGAQQLKNQWGTLRLKRLQKEVARYARDSLRLMAEIAVTRLSTQSLQAMTGIDLPMQAQKEQAQQIVQQVQSMGQEPPPEAAALLSTPSWEEVHALLQNDLLRSYRIDIETNSTVDAEATEDKQDITEMLTAMSQFLASCGPLIEQGVMPFEVAKDMLTAIVRRYRFGSEMEERFEALQQPAPKEDPKAAMELERTKLEMENDKVQREEDRAAKEMEMEFKRQEHAFKMRELAMKQEAAEAKHKMDMQKIVMQVLLPPPAPPAAAGGAPKQPGKGVQ